MGKSAASEVENRNEATRATNHGRPPGVRSSLTSRLLLGLCLLQFVLLATLNWGFWQPRKPLLRALAHRPTTDRAGAAVFRGHPGPWGELEYVRVNLEPPEEFVPVEDGVFEKARWFFAGYTRARLADFLTQCDLAAAQKTALLNPSVWSEEPGGITIAPGDEIVLGLSPKARTQIYSVLGGSERNKLQCWPFRFRLGGFDDWFAGRDFSPATLALVKRLVYERGPTLCFSDVMEALSRIPSAAERRQLVRSLAASSSLLMKLHIRPDSDVAALAAYWGQGFHTKNLETLFRSLAKVRGGVTIDVAQLLPPLARKKLNTFPVPADDPSSNAPPNCSWTALNFFQDPPNPAFHDSEVAKQELETHYHPVSEPTFGDLLLLLRPDGSVVHLAVFIADDVVFTKNGESPAKPWLLMQWEDVVAGYSSDQALQALIFRSNQRLN